MAQQTQLTPYAVSGRLYGSFAGKTQISTVVQIYTASLVAQITPLISKVCNLLPSRNLAAQVTPLVSINANPAPARNIDANPSPDEELLIG